MTPTSVKPTDKVDDAPTTLQSIEVKPKAVKVKSTKIMAVSQMLKPKSKSTKSVETVLIKATAKPDVQLSVTTSAKPLAILSRAQRLHPNLSDLLNKRRKRRSLAAYRIKRDADPRELLALLALLSDRNALDSISSPNDQEDQVVDEGGENNPFARATYQFLNQRPQTDESEDEIDFPSSFSRSRFGGIRTQQQRPKVQAPSRQVRLGFQPLSLTREPLAYQAKPGAWGEFTNLYRPESSDDENVARLYSLSNLLAENGRNYEERRKRLSYRRALA